VVADDERERPNGDLGHLGMVANEPDRRWTERRHPALGRELVDADVERRRQCAVRRVGRAPNDVYAVGTEGTLLHYDGTAWQPVVTPTPEAPVRHLGQRARRCLRRRQYRRDHPLRRNQLVAVADSPSRQNLRAVWGVGGQLFVAGWSGTVAVADPASWSTLVTAPTLFATWTRIRAPTYAVGLGGLVLRRDGSRGRRWPFRRRTTCMASAAAAHRTSTPSATRAPSCATTARDGRRCRARAAPASFGVDADADLTFIVGAEGTILAAIDEQVARSRAARPLSAQRVGQRA
jgi:hypothetical protein